MSIDIEEWDFTFTEEMVRMFIEISGDDNPIHDPDNSDIKKYGKPVVPGFMVAAAISQRPPKNWVVVKVNIKMSGAVFVGDTVKVKRVIEKERGKLRQYVGTISIGDEIKQSIEFTTIKL